MEGIDYTNLSPSYVASLGAAFACRYTGYFAGYDINNIQRQQGKCLYPSEASQLSQLGVYIVSNWEWYANRPIDSGSVGGDFDAVTANFIATACGMPSDRPIYFSYDYQTDGLAAAELDYIHAVANVIGLDRTGIYGPYSVVKNYLDMGLISWAWQTYAWSGVLLDPRANIYQYDNSPANYDHDRSMTADFGQWFVGGSQEEEDIMHVNLSLNEDVCITSPTVVGGAGYLCLSSDFGTAVVRIAVKHRNNIEWEVLPLVTVPYSSDHIVVLELGSGSYVDVTKISVVWQSSDNPNMPVGLDILPAHPF